MANRRHHHSELYSQDEPSWPELDEAIGELLEHPSSLFPGRRRSSEAPPDDDMTDEPRKGEA
jgi:hypothetical protein